MLAISSMLSLLNYEKINCVDLRLSINDGGLLIVLTISDEPEPKWTMAWNAGEFFEGQEISTLEVEVKDLVEHLKTDENISRHIGAPLGFLKRKIIATNI